MINLVNSIWLITIEVLTQLKRKILNCFTGKLIVKDFTANIFFFKLLQNRINLFLPNPRKLYLTI